MDKKYFEAPFILLTRGPGKPGPGDDYGPGSGGDGTGPYAVGYDEWMALFHEEKDGLDGIEQLGNLPNVVMIGRQIQISFASGNPYLYGSSLVHVTNIDKRLIW